MIWTANTPSIRQRIMKILVDEGPTEMLDLEKKLPDITRRQLDSALGKLCRDSRAHRVEKRPKQRNQKFAAGANPNLKSPDLYDPFKRQELEHRMLTNPHLRHDWIPRPDPAAAWLFNR
ncbi:hypothetical protein G167_gp05 [Burkholderia phage BcepMigl]|uniref:Uncharacterized protein n=1 Tax=Burkholderia phage BcepMigl TaxID=2886899 RepID=I6XKS8_9CAUD|nr:hypothetical protein G167_gp05 [Burkholderia phage BcepMigl]AFN39074.1 hypothetical protein BcepMigl_gp05 [Burkholderia phage BcepMigl]